MNWVLIGTLTIGMVTNGYLGLPVTSYNKALLNTSTFDDASFTTGRVLYISSSSGNDANTGASPGSAWRTLNKVASSILRPGDIVLLKRGDTWREQLTVPSSGSAGNVITFGAYGTGAAPIITGADSMSSFANGGSNIWNKTSVTTQPNVVMVGATTPHEMAASRAACTSAGDWFWAANTLSVYATSDPSGTVEAGQRDRTLQSSNRSYITIDGLTLRQGNSIFNSVNIGPQTVEGVTVQNCTVERGAGHGFEIKGSTTATSFTINNCTVQDNGGGGIVVTYAYATGTISNNTISGNGWGSVRDNVEHSGIDGKLGNLSIFGNSITTTAPRTCKNSGNLGNYCHGIYAESSTVVTNIYNNQVFSNGYGDGIKLVGSANVYQNRIYGNAASAIEAGQNGAVNVVYVLSNNVAYGNGTSNTGGGITEQSQGAGTISLSVYNNTLYQNAGTTGQELRIADAVSILNVKNNLLWTTANRRTIDSIVTQTGTVAIDYNLHWRADGVLGTGYNGSGKTWAQWQALGFDTHGVNADPLLTNPIGNDFTLTRSSPAINAGADLGGQYLAALLATSTWPRGVLTGNQNTYYGAGWEIGAYVYCPSLCVTRISRMLDTPSRAAR